MPYLDTNVTRTIYVLCNLNSSQYTSECIIKTHGNSLVWGENPKSRVSGTYVNKYIHIQPNMLYQLIGMDINGTESWTVVEIPLSPVEGEGVEYQYIDVTKDVQLFGYKYENSNVKIIPYTSQIENDTDIAFGPYLTDNGTSIDIEFFTYLDTSHYGTSTSDYALADFGEFYWMTEGTN